MQTSFRLRRPGLERTIFLVERHRLDASGDAESGFLDGAEGLTRLDAGADLPSLVARTLEGAEADWLALIRNPDLVLDEGLPDRIAAAIARAEALEGGVSLIAAGGLGPNGARLSALYASATPFIPHQTLAAPLNDPLPDIMVLDTRFLKEVELRRGPLPPAAFETVLVVEGYLAGRPALYAPELAAGINGDFRARDLPRVRAELSNWFGERLRDQVLPTLMGEVRIDPAEARAPRPRKVPKRENAQEAFDRVVERHAAPLSLSIVTRTGFRRGWLLERLLASITRARIPAMSLEIVLASDADPAAAAAETARLAELFPCLDIRLALSHGTPGESRVANLLGGIRAARNTHVAVMDDDDYVDLFAFAEMRRCLFGEACPLMVTGSRIHRETWVKTPSGRRVLAASVDGESYPASGWRTMFGGVNRLPVCGLVMPRERLLARIGAAPLNHDLSEDYALFLLVLTDPELPPIVEVPGQFGHISVREGCDNSVTLPDRRPWTRDIALFLSDLTRAPGVAGPGLWALLASQHTPEIALRDRTIAEQQAGVAERDRQIRLMTREIARLRAAAATRLEAAE